MENRIENNHDVDTLQIPSYMLTNHQSVENHAEPIDNELGNHTKASSEDEDIVVFNIGGEIFETLRETIQKDNISVLSNEEFLRRHYRPKAGGYFFDRDPHIFRAVLNYLRTDELHLPSYVCGPAAKTELAFWGVPPSKIERCCWTNYNDWNATLEALKRFEKDRKTKQLLPDTNVVDDVVTVSCWEKWRPQIWQFITRSNSSTGAKVLGVISLFFVFVSIFTFIAETTTPFQHFNLYPNSSYREPNTSAYAPNVNGSIESINSTVGEEKYKFITTEIGRAHV